MTTKIKITSMIVPGQEGVILFDAYVTDMGQSFTSTWNTEDVFGRNDPIATFQGTKRTISLSFDVPAGKAEEAEKNLQKCSKLASFLYPGYTGEYFASKNDISSMTTENIRSDGANSGADITLESSTKDSIHISRPPLIKIEFANLINAMVSQGASIKQGLLGFVDSYTFSPVVDAGFFGGSMTIYPRTISVSLTFTALHQTMLGFQKVLKDEDEKVFEGEDQFDIRWAADKLPFG